MPIIDSILNNIVSDGGIDTLWTAAKHLAEKVKSNHDIKKVFTEMGVFINDVEFPTDMHFSEMQQVLSENNMVRLANEYNKESGYTVKQRLVEALITIMSDYSIPRNQAGFYANMIIPVILDQLVELDPEKYDRYFQNEWRKESTETLNIITRRLESIEKTLECYRTQSIAIESAEQLDNSLRKQTNNPSIGITFFEIDDDIFVKNFEENRHDEIIRVRARCREEAIYCIINELWKRNETRPIYIVKSWNDWDKLLKTSPSGSIYIPWFEADSICAIGNNTNIFVYTDGLPSFSNDELALRPRTLQTVCNCLVNAGMDYTKAYSLANETHGLYIPLKKKIFNGQYLKTPKWSSELPEIVKKTGLLIGQWTDLDGDQEIISALSGLKYEEFINYIIPFSEGEDPFIIVRNNRERVFYLACVENSWDYIEISSEDKIWETFKNLFIEVLNESENLFIYTLQERLIAQYKGERLFWSSTIRNGMIRSLIMMAYYKNNEKDQSSLNNLVFSLLEHVKNEDQWKYISNFFKDLCEVAPETILDRLFNELTTSTGLMKLFEIQSLDPIFGKNYYIDILFGVEEFLVQDEYAARGYEWLLMLDDKSYEYKSNSPKDSISKVLCSWYNFSAYRSVKDKTIAAQKALELDKNSWDYIYEALPTYNTSMIGELHKPNYRMHYDANRVPTEEIDQTIEQYVLLLVENVDNSSKRWTKLLDIAYKLSESLFNRIIISVLSQITKLPEYEQMMIKNHIRRIIYRHRFYSSSSWAMGKEKLKRYDTLLDEIVIDVPEYEYVYLFDNDKHAILTNPIPYQMKGEREGNKEQREDLLRNSIAEFKEKQLSLRVLADACSKDKNSKLGRYLAKYDVEDAFNQNVFKTLYSAQESRRIALDYCNEMFLRDRNVFDKVIALKDAIKYSDEFIVEMYMIQAQNANDIPEIDSANNSIKQKFWKRGGIVTRTNFKWALKECKKYGTDATYLELLFQSHRIYDFSDEELLDYLKDLCTMPRDSRLINDAYYLEELLKPLQDYYYAGTPNAQIVATIELHYFGVLSWEQMICLQNEIKKFPDIYAEITSKVFKKDGMEAGVITEEQKINQKNWHNLFDSACFCPAEENGLVDTAKLDSWINRFIALLKENQQQSLFGYLLGRLWAYSPKGDDGYSPCKAVRAAIEKYADNSMMSAYKNALYNQRGAYCPSAGRGERALADEYKRTADYFKLNYPKTARIFYSLNMCYLAEASAERKWAENGSAE